MTLDQNDLRVVRNLKAFLEQSQIQGANAAVFAEILSLVARLEQALQAPQKPNGVPDVVPKPEAKN